ncbi:MAG: alpha/beta fold hydrolase [Pseudomonadales bacterium]|nr:alpha/beta fold hydrolase [Pseudomonadales bacterium]
MMSTKLGQLYVETKGQGVPFIWSHGLTHSIEAEKTLGVYDWSSLADSCQLIRYDALGHGQSSGSCEAADYRWPRLAQDIMRVADHCIEGHHKIEGFIAGGASMGCASSIYAALQQPERIKGLVLVIPPTAWQTRKAQIKMYEKLAATVEANGMEHYARQQRKTPLNPAFLAQLSPNYKMHRAQQLQHMSADYLPAIYRGAGGSDLPDTQALKSIRCPVLVLGWSGDTGHPASTAQQLIELIPGAQGVISNSAEEVRQWPARAADFIQSIHASE